MQSAGRRLLLATFPCGPSFATGPRLLPAHGRVLPPAGGRRFPQALGLKALEDRVVLQRPDVFQDSAAPRMRGSHGVSFAL